MDELGYVQGGRYGARHGRQATPRDQYYLLSAVAPTGEDLTLCVRIHVFLLAIYL